MELIGHRKEYAMNTQFYVIETNYASDIRFFAGGQVVNDSFRRCAECNAILPLERTGLIKISLDHKGRSGFTEYLWNSSLLILREDVVQLWTNNGITGFTVYPVEIIDQKRSPRRMLQENILTYKYVKPVSYVKLIEPPQVSSKCGTCGFIKYGFPKTDIYLPNGIQIDKKSWDGSDIFGLLGYGLLFCSERVLDITLPLLYKHIAFVRDSKWSTWEPVDVSKWTPASYNGYIESFLIRKPEDKNCK